MKIGRYSNLFSRQSALQESEINLLKDTSDGRFFLYTIRTENTRSPFTATSRTIFRKKLKQNR